MAWVDAAAFASRTAASEDVSWSSGQRPPVIAPLRVAARQQGVAAPQAGTWPVLALGLSIVIHGAAVMLVLPNRGPDFAVPAESSFELVYEPAASGSALMPSQVGQPEPLQGAAPAPKPSPPPLNRTAGPEPIAPAQAAPLVPEAPLPDQTTPPVPEPPAPQLTRVLHPAPEPPPPTQAEHPAVEPPPPARHVAQPHLGSPRRLAEPRSRAVGEAAQQAAPPPLIPPSPVAGMERNFAPAYPASALRRREQGRVILRVSVSAEGTPVAVDLAQSSGYPNLDSAALAAVRGWRFNPAIQAGHSVPGSAEIPVQFRLAN